MRLLIVGGRFSAGLIALALNEIIASQQFVLGFGLRTLPFLPVPVFEYSKPSRIEKRNRQKEWRKNKTMAGKRFRAQTLRGK